MRRQIVTHPQFQIKFTLSFVVGTLLMLLLLGACYLASLSILAHDPALSPDQSAHLMTEMRRMSVWLAIGTVVSAVGFGAVGLYLSYKFVGPLSRLEHWLSEVVEGRRPAPLFLRPGDELEPLVEVLNRVLPTDKGQA